MQATSTIATHPPRTRGQAGSASSVGSAWRALAALSLWLLAALLPQIALAGSTTTALASSSNPINVGVAHNLTATIVGVNPTGNVTFKSGTTTIGTVALSGTGNTRTAVLNYTWTTAGAKSLTAVYAGDAGNTTSTSNVLSQVVSKATPSVTLTADFNPSKQVQKVTFTAQVVNGANYPGAGYVQIRDGATQIGRIYVSGGYTPTASYPQTFVTNALTVGTHNITAYYEGDANNATATSPILSQVVNPSTTAVALTSDFNPSKQVQKVTFTAQVVNGASYPGAAYLQIRDGATQIGRIYMSGNASPTASYSQTFVTNALTVGTHNITAYYEGDANNPTVTSPILSQVVNPSTAAVTLTSSASSIAAGGSVTFTAQVVNGASYPGAGYLQIKDGATQIGRIYMSSNYTPTASYSQTFTTSALTAGTHSITAYYEGDANNPVVTSPVLSQIVTPPATSTVVTSSVNPSVAGSAVTFTATTTGTNPTGTVTFKDGATVLGTSSVSAKVATFTTSSLGAATHNISAVYSGDSANAGSTSASIAQVVNVGGARTTLAANLSASTLGTPITFTASVVGFSPTGTVTFNDGAAVLGAATLNAGVATFTTSSLAVGTHNIIATYGGDANNSAGTTSSMTLPVLPKTPTVSLTLPNSASTGQAVLLKATITGATPTGTVSFMEGATSLGNTVVVAGATNTQGVATFSYTGLTAGSHTIVANYSGDAINNAAVSGSALININQVATVTGSAQTYQYGYDAMGRLTTAIDPLGNTNYTYYDALGRPVQTQQPAGVGQATPTIIEMAYNGADSLVKVSDPRMLDTTYTPNGLGQVVSQTSPDSGAASFTYDANGNLLTKTDARGKLSTLTYDVRDRLTSITYASGTPTTLEYDGGTSPYAGAKGELTKITDASGSQTYTYDSAGRLIAKTQITLSNTGYKTFTVAYTWGDTGSAIDKLTSITYPSGNRVNYSYDATGQLAGVSINGVNANGIGTGGTTTPLLSGITTRADGALQGWQWASAGTHSLGYDSFGQLVSYPLGKPDGSGTAAGQIRTISRDAAGRITGFSHTNNATATPTPTPSLNQSYTYDNLNRVLSSSSGGVVTQYSYDATGNRTSKIINATTYTNTVSPTSNRLTQVQDVGGSASLQYDAAGNITADGNNTYVYSDRGRMNRATNAGGTVAYTYNALEQRVSKSGPTGLVPTGASYFVYDESGNLLGEYDANSNPVYETVYLGSGMAALPVGVMKLSGSAASSTLATSLYNVYADHTSTPRVITRTSDSVMVWRWDTAEAFGATAPDQNPSSLGTFTFNQRFPGQVFDAETGLNQNWNREYDPRQGRYRQSDPIGLAGGINTYSYVEGNPVSFIDPLGLWAIGFELYGGIGGGLTLTCSDGKIEIISRLGVGVGGGFNLDPLQQVSPHAVEGAGAVARTYATAGLALNASVVSLGATRTWRSGNAVTTKVGGGYSEINLPPQYTVANWRPRLDALISTGVEFGGHIDLKACGCK